MSEQLTRYTPEAPGRETRDIVCECASCKEPIYAGQYTNQCDCCGRGNTCCLDKLPIINGMSVCADCEKDWREFDTPHLCALCDASGIQGEMVQLKNGWMCDACGIIRAALRAAIAA